jgi:hypothetical protein
VQSRARPSAYGGQSCGEQSHESARPFHCPDCYQVIMPRAKPENWKEYKTVAEAQRAGHVSPCSFCFG